VRYGWADAPEDINLYNLDGFPASPFRTDKWPLVTESAGFYKK
jgi:sialate O-acetylesterase